MQLEARLRAFAAVARTSSFSRAAEELYVSQPAVSKHVASLERDLGTRLVSRGRSGTTLTPDGEVVADYVLRAEALLANAERAVAAGPHHGVLSLAASGIPGTYLLPERLAEFHEAYPVVEIDFHVGTSGEALELVRAHRVELAVVGGLDVPPELVSEPLVEDELVLVGPPSLAGRRLRAKDLAGRTWFSREEGSSTRAAVEAARWQLGLHAVRTLELPSWEAVKLAVARGTGIAAISRFALDLELETGALAVLDVPRWRVTRTISVVTARDVPLTPTAARFVDLLRRTQRADEVVLPPNSNLPAPPTRLIGRERELREVAAALRGGTRLLTLTGTGGSGKTRLAEEAAARLVDTFGDGVYLVELAGVDDPTLVLPHILRVVGAERPAALGGRRLLLLLDTFEHLLAAAPAVAELLAASDHLRVLVTSRAPLRLRAEREYEVPPLPVRDAVALFVERALAVDPAFEDDRAVRTICERLDGLPLAIELAASRVRTFPAAALAERLEERLLLLAGGAADLPARQRTLRNTIAWSFDLLPPPAQSAFESLSVFRGGWTAAAGDEVSGADTAALEALRQHHLVTFDGKRFGMLDTIREYAAERLEARGDAAEIRRRHGRYFLALARSAHRLARGPEEPASFARLERESDNLRAALSGAAIDDVAFGLELADALEAFITRRHLFDVLGLLERLLERGAGAPPGLRVGPLTIAGILAVEAGRRDDAERWLDEAIDAARASGDDDRAAWALKGLGRLAFDAGDLARARNCYQESFELFDRLGRSVPAGGRLNDLALVARAEGDLPAARTYLEQSLTRSREANDPNAIGADLHGLGDLALDEEDFAGARALFLEGLPYLQEALPEYGVAHVLGGLAAVAAGTGRPETAARLWSAVLAYEQESGVTLERPSRTRYLELLGTIEPDGAPMALDEAIELAVSAG